MECNKKEIDAMIEDIAQLIATYKITEDGLEFVSETKYWEWLTSEVVKVGNTPWGEKIKLEEGKNITEWILSKIGNESAEKYTSHLFVNRGAEYDFIQEMRNSPLEILKGNRWRMATQDEDLKQGIDAIRYNIFDRKEHTVQIKAGLSDSFKTVNLQQYMPEDNPQISERMQKGLLKKRTPVDEVYVNEKIWKWRNSEKGKNVIIKRGDNHPNVNKLPMKDTDIKKAGEKRFDNAAKGNVENHILASKVIGQIGKGAIIGGIAKITASVIINYKKYKNGYIDEQQFLKTIALDGVQGGVEGGMIAAINVPVQIVAANLGLGAPVTVPVMIVVGKTARKIIEPAFGKGQYLRDKNEMYYAMNLQQGLSQFCIMSFKSFEDTNHLINRAILNRKKFEELEYVNQTTDYINQTLDDEINSILGE